MKLPTLDSVWLILPLAGVVLAASVEPLPPYDFWWHLVMGRHIATEGIPNTQLFLYTMAPDAPFHDQPWLAQWLMYQVYELGGHVGGMLLRSALLIAAWCVLLAAVVRRSGPRVGGFLTLATVIVSYPVLTYRTRLFAFLPFVILIVTLLDDRRSKWAPLWLFAATVWWANVHGTFVLAPVLAVGALGAEVLEALAQRRVPEFLRARGRWWAAVIGATATGTLVTPHGWKNLSYVVDLAVTSNVSSTVSEWLPPDVTTGIGIMWAVAFVAALAVLFLRRSEVRVLEVALFLATTYLAASAIRSVFWWAAVAALVLAPHASTLVKSMGDEEASDTTDDGNILNLAIIVAFAVAAIGLHPGIAPTSVRMAVGGGRLAAEGPGAGILSSEHALAEVQLAQKAGGNGRVFHDQALGGVLEWKSAGATQVAFVDQRMELIPEAVWDAFFEVSSAVNWRETFADHDVRAAVLSVEDQWPLIQALDESPDWSVARIGQRHWVFVKSDSPSLDGAQNPPEQAD